MNSSYDLFELVLDKIQQADFPVRERLVMARNSDLERASEMTGESSVNYKLVIREERRVMWRKLGLHRKLEPIGQLWMKQRGS